MWPIVDGHCDVLMSLLSGSRKFSQPSSKGHVDLPRLRLAGVTVSFWAVFVEPEFKPERALKRTMQILDIFFTELANTKEDLVLITNRRDLARAQEQQKLGIVLTLEGGDALGEDLAVLRVFWRLGIRCLGLTWNGRNSLADGVGESLTGGGLTRFGRKVVEEANRLGILIDVAHLSPAGINDVLEMSSEPVIASHSNCQAICPHPRNLSDAQILGLAKKDAVIGVTFAPQFLRQSRLNQQPESPVPPEADIQDVLNHLDHLMNLVGVDHIGIGSDFDGIASTPRGLEDVSKLPALADGLLQRGCSKAAVGQIMGGNLLRLLNQILPE